LLHIWLILYLNSKSSKHSKKAIPSLTFMFLRPLLLQVPLSSFFLSSLKFFFFFFCLLYSSAVGQGGLPVINQGGAGKKINKKQFESYFCPGVKGEVIGLTSLL